MATSVKQQQAMTFRANGLANRVIIPVEITNDKGISRVYPALIDTGATHTCVSEELVNDLKLISVGDTETGTAGGKVKAKKYVADLSLNNGLIRIPKHKLISAKLTQLPGVEMLIGMDILMHGDFALTNQNKLTVASLRVPSSTVIDFVPEANQFNKFEIAKAKRAANKPLSKKHKKKKKGHKKGHKRSRKGGRR